MLLNRVVYVFSEGLTNTTRLSSKPGRVGVGGSKLEESKSCFSYKGMNSDVAKSLFLLYQS